ncbi:hypothetical protein FF125_05750 [Aureibaculum algae]|uniref:Uncharacterized protein n=1 Tax=Aureibaculum algae TaxID=2584122 RepID=A0A5B7TNY1_9FLAO|nr:hypothetical protein [Aureibaculum algae]QCX37960.1 hypothetical protein FF125_05750 [Aureibaculum algae]
MKTKSVHVKNRNNSACWKNASKSNYSLLHYIIILLIFSASNTLQSQASLAAENRIDDLVVTTDDGEKKTYSVFRDAEQTDQYYYVPNEARVTTTKDKKGKEFPDLTLLRYQYDPSDGGPTQQGGIIQGTMTMAAEPEVIETMKKYILKKAPKAGTIKLAPIPLEKCDFEIRTEKGLFLGNPETNTAFQGPLIANQKMGFSLSLNELGAAVISELATGKGGVLISVSIKYRGLTPPCGYNITGKWESVYEYYQKQTKLEGGLSLGPIKLGGSKTKEEIIEDLNETSGVKVERIKCPSPENATGNSTDESLEDEHFQRLKDKIENEVLSKEYKTKEARLTELQSLYESTDDEGIKKKLMDEITMGEKSLKAGYQNSVKDIKNMKKGTISYDSRTQYLESRETTFFGLIGFSKFNMTEEELKENGHIIDINANDTFPYIAIGLQDINLNFDLRSLALDISYTNSEGDTNSLACRWTPEKKWRNFEGASIDYLRFNLIGEKDIERRNEPKFNIKLQVNSKLLNGDFIIEKEVQLEKGKKNMDGIGQITKQLSIDGSSLSFHKITGDNSDLDLAEVTLKIGDLIIKKAIKPYVQNGVYGEPKPIVLLVPKDETSISSEVNFITKREEIKKTALIEITENTLRDLQWRTFDDE